MQHYDTAHSVDFDLDVVGLLDCGGTLQIVKLNSEVVDYFICVRVECDT